MSWTQYILLSLDFAISGYLHNIFKSGHELAFRFSRCRISSKFCSLFVKQVEKGLRDCGMWMLTNLTFKI